MALAALLGGGALNDAYVAAIKLPNQFRQIFGEGSFNAAYLPTYTNVLEVKGAEEAPRFASQVFTLLILSQIALLGLVYLDMPLGSVHLAGFAASPTSSTTRSRCRGSCSPISPSSRSSPCIRARSTPTIPGACPPGPGCRQSLHDRLPRLRRPVSRRSRRASPAWRAGDFWPRARRSSPSR